jgi:diguanylate cyclase (GGDEF)-like protein
VTRAGASLPQFSSITGSRFQKVDSVFEWILSKLSFYAIPIAIGLVSLTSLFLWDDQYASKPEKELKFHVFSQSEDQLSPADALARLTTAPLKQYFDTKLSTSPVWFIVETGEALNSTKFVEIPSRHAVELACWDATSLRPLGRAIGKDADGQISPTKSGYSIKLDHTGSRILCQTSFVGPAHLSLSLWSSEELDISSQNFHRKSGLLDGGMLMLTIFVLVTALINRQKLYLVFGAWLVLGLRVGSTSGGWDTQWLNHSVPPELLTVGRSLTMASYALMTITLYRTLFKKELARTRYARFIEVAHWLCIPLILSAILLPRIVFIPTLWVLATPGLLLMIVSLVSIVSKTRSRVAILYGAALAFIFLSGLSAILTAAYGVNLLIGAFNSVTAAFVSSLLTSLAIAEQMRMEHSQRIEQQEDFRNTYDAIPIGLFTIDLSGFFLSANPAMFNTLGPKLLSDGHNAWQNYFPYESWTQLHQMVHNKVVQEIEIKARPLLGSQGHTRFLVKAILVNEIIEGSLQDVTEKSRAIDELSFLASHDPLTKVLNRRGIENAMTKASALSVNKASVTALAYLDLDRFKLINDLFGHGVGDDVLQQVCQRVSDLMSGDCKIGRVGGDEFVVVFSETPIVIASVVCRAILSAIADTNYQVGHNSFHVRCSIGLIEVLDGMAFNDAISTADRACRQAKTGKGDGLVVYERSAPAFMDHETELKLISILSTNSATSGLYLEMQPIMSLTSPHASLNFEVLLRMRDREGLLVRTDHLINAGEACGRMGMIDRWVLKTTFDWLNKNHNKLKDTNFVCINLSGASLNDEHFLEHVYTLLKTNPHLVSKICLEITESVALHDLQTTRRFVDRVRGYGAKIALDDFGAGYTSFSYLKQFTADLLKIDGSFIVDMNNHPANIAIVEAIVNLAKNLGMKVIAEWAEDNATVRTLAEIGVDYVQGFVVARPQHPDHILAAESAATFINNDELAQYALVLGQTNAVRAQVDLFSEDKANQNLH